MRPLHWTAPVKTSGFGSQLYWPKRSLTIVETSPMPFFQSLSGVLGAGDVLEQGNRHGPVLVA